MLNNNYTTLMLHIITHYQLISYNNNLTTRQQHRQLNINENLTSTTT
jgi:hypothetical protein